jgi:hypothetical protein
MIQTVANTELTNLTRSPKLICQFFYDDIFLSMTSPVHVKFFLNLAAIGSPRYRWMTTLSPYGLKDVTGELDIKIDAKMLVFIKIQF